MTTQKDALAAGLVWISYGGFGRQLAHLDRAANRDVFIGHKWRENSRTWVGPLRIPRYKILEAASIDNPVVRHALNAGRPGRPACRHETHDLSQLPIGDHPTLATGFSLKGEPR